MAHFQKSRFLFIGALVLLVSGCANIVYKEQLVAAQTPSPRKWMVFFDGTHNDIAANTNVKRLHSLISLQDRPDVGTLYVEGVGVGADIIIGAGLGGGFSRRVRLGYEFLLKNYRADDEIYIFGFSRGAYQARALASMLHYVGLPDKPLAGTQLRETCSTRAVYKGQTWKVKPQNQEDFVESLYAEMKAGLFSNEVADCVAAAQGATLNFKSRNVAALGLWDTVEALGKPNWTSRILDKTRISPNEVIIDDANARYGDQLFNVDKVFHAVSIDDDREWVFTPLLASRCHLLQPKSLPKTQQEAAQLSMDKNRKWACTAAATPAIQEVFFSGAHSDVGGGSTESDLNGVSLNWMINRLASVNPSLLPSGTRVREDPYGSSHDPEAGSWGALYHKASRNLAAYAMGATLACANSKSKDCEVPASSLHETPINEPLPAFRNTLCVHESVFKRRKAMAVKAHENGLLQLRAPGNICVAADNTLLANPPVYKEVVGFPPTKDASGQLRCDEAAAEVHQPAVPIRITAWRETTRQCEEASQ